MLLLLDVGNTHVHCGLANARRVVRTTDFSTSDWRGSSPDSSGFRKFVGASRLRGACFCSVVPSVNAALNRCLKREWEITPLQLGPDTLRGVGIDYPRPETIGQDRLANALAARHAFGDPVVVVDFGTAVTFDVVNREGNYVGGIIAPGLSVMTDYLHEKTALLPKIRIREIRSVIGRSTEQAMLVGAVHGYRGLVRELIRELKRELKTPRLPVVATGGYAALIARGLPEITAVRPGLTLEGLRLLHAHHSPPPGTVRAPARRAS